MAASVLSIMAATPSAQLPLMPVFRATSAPDTTIYGPMMPQDATLISAVAAHMPQDLGDKEICVSITGPSKCHDSDSRDFTDCVIHVSDCDEFKTSDINVSDDDTDMDNDDWIASDDEGSMYDDDNNDSDDDEDMPTGSEPATVSATATGVDEHHHGMPTTAAHMNMDMARATGTGIPQSIQDALIHDKNAPRSLANDFSGSKSPQWYKDLPKDQRQLFLTQQAPKKTSRPKPTSTRHHDIEVIACGGAGKSLKQLREQNIMDNKVAKLYSSAAKEHSKVAKKQSCSALMSEARAESSIASLYSAQAKKRRDEMKRKFGKKNGAPQVSVPKLTAVFAVSLTMAVASLGVALFL